MATFRKMEYHWFFHRLVVPSTSKRVENKSFNCNIWFSFFNASFDILSISIVLGYMALLTTFCTSPILISPLITMFTAIKLCSAFVSISSLELIILLLKSTWFPLDCTDCYTHVRVLSLSGGNYLEHLVPSSCIYIGISFLYLGSCVSNMVTECLWFLGFKPFSLKKKASSTFIS